MATKTYDATDGVLASTPANWVGGVAPIAGDDVVFDATAGADNCTWDLALTLGSFSMNTGYTGTVTQAVSFSVTSYSQAAGTFTGDSVSTLTVSGSFIWSSGTISSDPTSPYLVMTGISTTLSLPASLGLTGLTIQGSVSLSAAPAYVKKLTVSGTFHLGSNNLYERVYGDGSGFFSNTGTIDGTGYLCLITRYADYSLSFGIINCPLILSNTAPTNSYSFITTAPAALGSTLTINSVHASYTVGLDLSATNYALSATDITIGTRGILNGRGSTITCSGNWDSSAGAFTQGTSTLICGATGNLKCAADGVYNLRVASGVTTTLTAALNVYKNLRIIGTLARGANTVSLLGAGEQTVSGYPDTAITVNSTGPVIFHECAHHVADVTFTAGTCVWTGYAKYVTRGNLSISAISRKPNPFTDVQNVSGTLTFDAEARMRNLTTDAGQTTVQSAGVKLGISGVVATAGTFTMNTPSKILRGMLAVPIPFPANYPVNPPSVGG